MIDYYKILALRNTASGDEIRRAYRILARRYHPDLNPGDAESHDRFKLIAEAYSVLSDEKKREFYDLTCESYQRKKLQEMFRSYHTANKEQSFTKEGKVQTEADDSPKADEKPDFAKSPSALDIFIRKSFNMFGRFNGAIFRLIKGGYQFALGFLRTNKQTNGDAISIVEIPIAVEDAIKGVNKRIEVNRATGNLSVDVSIPSGVRDGSVIRLPANKQTGGEIIVITRLQTHPFLSIKQKGLVAEIPISILEAIQGAQISVPTVDGSTIIKIPAGSQSGDEIRLREKGLVSKNGSKGDYFIRIIVRVPESHMAVGILDKAREISEYYGQELRRQLPTSLV